MINKTEDARRQLGTALQMFLHGEDPVSIHTLAMAGGAVAEHLARKAGAAPFYYSCFGNLSQYGY
jgi:hypothetical protein